MFCYIQIRKQMIHASKMQENMLKFHKELSIGLLHHSLNRRNPECRAADDEENEDEDEEEGFVSLNFRYDNAQNARGTSGKQEDPEPHAQDTSEKSDEGSNQDNPVTHQEESMYLVSQDEPHVQDAIENDHNRSSNQYKPVPRQEETTPNKPVLDQEDSTPHAHQPEERIQDNAILDQEKSIHAKDQEESTPHAHHLEERTRDNHVLEKDKGTQPKTRKREHLMPFTWKREHSTTLFLTRKRAHMPKRIYR